MTAYHIKYSVKDKEFENFVDAKDLKSAKTKLGRKHGYKTGNMITIKNVKVIGYY